MHVVLEFLQNLVLERALSVSAPFLLQRLVPVTPVAQAEPGTVLRSIQVPRRIHPDPAGCHAPHGDPPERRFPFLEFPDRFLPRSFRFHSGAFFLTPQTPPPPVSSHARGHPPAMPPPFHRSVPACLRTMPASLPQNPARFPPSPTGSGMPPPERAPAGLCPDWSASPAPQSCQAPPLRRRAASRASPSA